MKKILFVLFALVTVGAASARPVDENVVDGSRSMWMGYTPSNGGNELDGTRSFWMG